MISLIELFPSFLVLIFSSIAVIELFLLSKKSSKNVGRKIFLISIGILFSVTVHSIVELLAVLNFFSTEFTFLVMNFLLILGSSFFLLAGLLAVPKFILLSPAQSISILHIDDNETVLETTKTYCERNRNDFSFTSISDPIEALELLSFQKFDVVICDYEMPGLNGLQVLEKLRDNGNDIPFIMFTGKGREEVAMKALNLGANYYLMKGLQSIKTQYGELIHMILQITTHQRTEEALKKTNILYSPLAPLISKKYSEKKWIQYRDFFTGFSVVFLIIILDIIADYFLYFSGSFLDYLLQYNFLEHFIFIFLGSLLSFFWWKKGTSLNLIKNNFDKIYTENEKLKAQNQVLNDFTIQMGHDLKGSLNIINGYSSLCHDNEAKMDCSIIIQKNIKKINDLVTRSLELAHSGIAVRKDSHVKLKEIIEETGSLLSKNITIIAQELPSVTCDRLKVAQIFQNLFENAIIHGNATVISITNEYEDFTHKIQITNNGKIIPQNVRNKLLKQKPISKKMSFSFGLFIVKRLVEAHGWKIFLSSQDQTTFVITIPEERDG
ncbi:MAG: Sensor protein ZraS [Candidatus Heimdallarchaeota archaeon LC_3]|nr:MAG: Sensor protein ZraS [Candidatus Heimdallarchaeota archaeon LC_3]